MSDIDYIKVALEKKVKEDYSEKYKSMLRFSYRCLLKEHFIQNIFAYLRLCFMKTSNNTKNKYSSFGVSTKLKTPHLLQSCGVCSFNS